jgi:hypothetical protein
MVYMTPTCLPPGCIVNDASSRRASAAVGRGRGVLPCRLDRHAQARPESFRDLPLDSARERARCIRCRCRFDPVDGLRESDNDPNCALCVCRVSVGPLGLHKPIRSGSTRPWWRYIGSGFWCCHWGGSRGRAGSRSRSSDRRGNRDIWRSRYYTSTPTGHLLRLPSLRISCLRISGLPTVGLWISRLLGLWVSGLWIPCLPRIPGLLIPRRLGISRLLTSHAMDRERAGAPNSPVEN